MEKEKFQRKETGCYMKKTILLHVGLRTTRVAGMIGMEMGLEFAFQSK